MARYDHLRLVKLPEQLERRKRPGFGNAPERDRPDHSRRIASELDEAVSVQQRRRPPEAVNPSLILRVRMTGSLFESDWEALGLTVLSSDADRTLVLFSTNDELQEFRTRLAAYGGPIPAGQAGAPYANFVGSIASIGTVEPRDRIGSRLREDGFTEPADFDTIPALVADLELWDLGRRDLRQRKLSDIEAYVVARGGEWLDEYIGPSITMGRVRASGAVIRALLSLEEVASIDLPPVPDLATADAVRLELGDIPPFEPLGDDAPLIGIIDSGVNDHPLIADILVGAIGVPERLGTADEWGHGTRVGGVAVFGDLRSQIASGALERGARLCAAKVVNERGAFDDRRLVPSQMREAVTTLNERFGCRLFVIALADTKRVYDGGKVGTWAATLDELAREMNVVIVVSAGNRAPRGGNRIEQAVTEYPRYLAEEANRLFEPAGAINVVTVGSLSHGNGLDGRLGEEVAVRPITTEGEPSPFTRAGPGVEGSIKPDFIDLGGTMVLDPLVQRLRDGRDVASAGLLTLHHRPVEQLITSGSGTSYAAPILAFKAAQILTRFPQASANLIRALLASSASIPEAAQLRLAPLGEDITRSVCGYGQVDLEKAAFSDDARVVLFAEDELPIDHFAIYELPIPALFQSTNGRRTIQITLAFDPPVRHSRNDYAGVGMSFRLVRGCEPALISEHFKKRPRDEDIPDIAKRFQCQMKPGPQLREKSTLQSAIATFKADISNYGDRYYIVVRCESGWATELVAQRFALVVEVAHEANIQIYQQIRQRIQLRT